MTIDQLGLKPRTLNLLNHPVHWKPGSPPIAVPHDVSALVQVSHSELLKIRLFGRRALLDLVVCLQRHGYEFPDALVSLKFAARSSPELRAALARTKKKQAKAAK